MGVGVEGGLGLAGLITEELLQDGARSGALFVGRLDQTGEDAVVVRPGGGPVAKGDLAQNDAGPQGLLGGVVGGLTFGMFHKGQQALAVFDQPLAKGFHLRFGPWRAADSIQLSEPPGAPGFLGGGRLAGLGS